MKVSHQWLNHYVDLSELTIERITEIMTEIGLEVEGYEKTENIKGGLRGIYVGLVEKCSEHPNADKLKLTEVNIGKEKKLQIVCGAPNVAEGQKVPVAIEGTTLYGEEEESFTIKKGKIRGEVSEGMICSEDELNLSGDHSGIMVLPSEYQVGDPLNKYIEVKEDFIIEVDLTPNRADATHHKGIAFDIAAYLATNGQSPHPFTPRNWNDIPAPKQELPLEISVEDVDACPRYAGIVLKNIQVRPSPPWLQERLQSIGLKPRNNVVDTTNYILHDMGQPLHAFDYSKIKDKKIRVEKLNAGTKFVTLDEAKLELTGEELMICDGNSQALCMAGIYGSNNSGVTEDSETIFLESAYFDPKTIRKASMHHQLRTDAAKVYEKGADPNQLIPALKMAVQILTEIASAEVASQVFDTKPEGFPRKEVKVQLQKVRQYLGLDIEKSKLLAILQNLDLEILSEEDKSITVGVPTNKPDVLREVDVIEEIIRVFGLGKIPTPDKIELKVTPSQYPDNFQYRESVGQALSGAGMMETMSLSLVPSSWYDNTKIQKKLVFINNTSNRDLNALRPDMISCQLSNISYNVNRQAQDLAFFEFGKVYWKDKGEGYQEEERLSLALSGKINPQNWKEPKGKESDFFHLKAYVEKVFSHLGLEGFQVSELEDHPHFSYGLKWHRGPKVLVELGKVKRSWTDLFNLEKEVFIADIRWGVCTRAAQRSEVTFTPISKYPSVGRDLALILDDKVTYEEVRSTIFSVDKKLIGEVTLFDVYKNAEQLGENKKSYAVHITFENHERTMKDKEIDQRIKKIINKLEKRLGAKLR